MTIQRTADGSVVIPGSTTLAGSALCLDQAVRNLISWKLADPGTALSMASVQPAALLAPALAWSGVAARAGCVTWSQDYRPIDVTVDGRRVWSA